MKDFLQNRPRVSSPSGSKLGQGRDATMQLLKDNPELCDEIEKQIMDKIKAE